MSSSADASVVFGFGFEAEGDKAYPPAWVSRERDWDELDVSKIPLEELKSFETYGEMDDEPDEEGEVWPDLGGVFECLIRARGFEDLLDIAYGGGEDYSAPFIYAKGFRDMIECGELHQLGPLNPVGNLKLSALIDLAEELGVPAERIGWHVIVWYG